MIVGSPYSEIKKKSGFIVIEGVNGAGKSSICSHCVKFLNQRGFQTVKTFEPGDTPLGKQIREIVLGDKRCLTTQLSELFLFQADRAEHVNNIIQPSLKDNKVVICDRYTYSTTAFQGYGRGIDLSIIDKLNYIATAGVSPDFVLLLDLDPNIGLSRNKMNIVQGDTFSVDALEHEEIEFHRRIRNGFLNIAKNGQDLFVVIDASQSLESVTKLVDEVLNTYIS